MEVPVSLSRSLRRAKALLSRRSLAELLPSGDAIFLHRPHGQPCHGITPQVISDFDRLSLLLLRNPLARRYAVPDDLTFITYHNYPFESLVERCYDAYGIHNYVVLGRRVQPWDWGAKVRLVLHYLDSGACATAHVVCTDADDILMVADPGSLLDRFRRRSCDVLFCGTFVDFPPDPRSRDFETLRYPTHPLHCRLSAGAYVGAIEPLAAYLRELAVAGDERRSWAHVDGTFVDQLGWRRLHALHYPKIQVDHGCSIFKRYDLFRDVVE